MSMAQAHSPRLADYGANDVLSVEEAAAILRIGRSAAYIAARTGEIPSVKIGRHVRIPRWALAARLSAPEDEGSIRP